MLCSLVLQKVVLGDVNVSPVGDLNFPLQSGSVDEGTILLKVDGQGGSFQELDVLIGTKVELLP